MTCFYSYKLRYMLNFSGLMSTEQLLENAFIQTHKNIHHDLKVAKTMANENPLECYYTADFT